MRTFNFEEFRAEWKKQALERGEDLEAMAEKAGWAFAKSRWNISEKDFERMVEEILGYEK